MPRTQTARNEQIAILHKAGIRNTAIAERLGLTPDYVSRLITLQENRRDHDLTLPDWDALADDVRLAQEEEQVRLFAKWCHTQMRIDAVALRAEQERVRQRKAAT